MLTGLTIALATSLILFVITLGAAALTEHRQNQAFLKNSPYTLGTSTTMAPTHTFKRAARRPVRVLGSYII